MKYEQSAALKKLREYRGPSHVDGTCGGMAGLCGACGQDQAAEMLAWARLNVCTPPAVGQDVGDWWAEVGGPFLDCWAYVAWERAQVLGARLECGKRIA